MPDPSTGCRSGRDPDDAARSPEVAVLSALVHGGRPEHRAVLDALVGAFAAVDEGRAALYYDVLLGVLPTAARDHLEAVVSTRTYEYRSDFARRYFAEGRAEGRAEGLAEGLAEGEASAVLGVLDARGLAVPDEARARIASCRDLDQLGAWLRQAATAASIDDLLL